MINFRFFLSVGGLGFAIFLFFACNGEAKNEIKLGDNAEKSILKKDSVQVIQKPEFKQSYSIDSLSSQTEIDSFLTRYSQAERLVIFALNRLDPERLKIGLPLLIPDSISENLMFYSPFPERLELLDFLPKTLLIAQRIQAFAVYENGNLCRWGPVSSGKESTKTPNGLHYANYKAKRKISTINGSWIMPYYVNFMNFDGIGTHEYTLPGYPASHACVRMYSEDAQFIYHWIDMWKLKNDRILANGTPFMVFGEYDFTAISPWLKLAEDPLNNNLNPAEVDTLRKYVARFKANPLNWRKEELSQSKLIL